MAVLLWMAPPARADHFMTLDPHAGTLALAAGGESWLDPTGRRRVAEVAADGAIPWEPTAPGTIYPVNPDNALWIRVRVTELDDSERWYLEVPYPAVNRVTLYAADRQGRWVPSSAGDTLPVADWPLPHRHPLLPLQLQPGEPQTFFVRVENPHSYSAPLQFVSERQLVRQEQRTALILGLYFGLAGLAIVLAVVAAFTLRDAAFGWYAASVLLMGLSQAALTGVAGLHLWPRAAWWNDLAVLVLPILTVAVLHWFFSAVIGLRQRSQRLFRLLGGVSIACIATAAALPFIDPGLRVRAMTLAIVFGVTAGISVIAWAASRGDRHAGWLLLGLLPVAVGSALPLARGIGLIPVSFWTQHSMQMGIAIELPVLLAVLLARTQDRRENIRRLAGLQRTDPATGLINGEVFAERLDRLIARSERLKLQSAVLLVDLVNSDGLRRQFDRRSAEEMPLHVAGRLLSTAREIDSVARISEHRFGMLVEGPLTPEEAAATGPKVVARCLMPFKGKPVEYVAQVRVAQTLVPSGAGAGKVIEKLGAVLAAVPADSKRAVFTIR
ncbi:MAG TPA: 7TM diverse intracellular signaling domain-containing protein [Ramlibacter sp.]|nr:7TM diverse intracellular signaling domain-containing protein [Ramlibacter sp.]